MRIAVVLALVLTHCAEPAVISREDSADITDLDAEPRVEHDRPPRMRVEGAVPHDLAGRWSTKTAMVVDELSLTAEGRFDWRMHGCLGTTAWVGEARRRGDELLLVPDTPDRIFGGGRILAVQTGDEVELVPHARSAIDRSGDHPFTRVAARE